MAVVALALQVFFGSLFVLAALPKMAQAREFERAVAEYRLLPAPYAHVFARGLPWLELVAGLALLIGVFTAIALMAVALCLVVFAMAAATNLLRARVIDCGCQGGIAPRTISWGLVIKDVLLAGVAAFAASTPVSLIVVGVPWPQHSNPVSASALVALYAIAIAVAVL